MLTELYLSDSTGPIYPGRKAGEGESEGIASCLRVRGPHLSLPYNSPPPRRVDAIGRSCVGEKGLISQSPRV